MSPFPFPSLLENGKLPEQVSRAIQRASTVIAVSRHSAAQIVDCGFSAPIVIPNVVDERRFVPSERRKGNFVFLTVANLTRQKGIDLLLQAIANWRSIPNNILFRIVGDGNEKGELVSLSYQLGLKNKIEWLGARGRDALPALYAESDCFVLPSRHESFGVVYAEAHACGKPVIATKCGGPEDIVTPENGLLVPTEDVDQLTNALEYMYRNAREYSADAIRKTLLTRYSRAAVASQISQVYQQVTGICLS
jgi:glycosyltransferase involved in cell wall biosynthesis